MVATMVQLKLHSFHNCCFDFFKQTLLDSFKKNPHKDFLLNEFLSLNKIGYDLISVGKSKRNRSHYQPGNSQQLWLQLSAIFSMNLSVTIPILILIDYLCIMQKFALNPALQ